MFPTPASSDWSSSLTLMACRERPSASAKRSTVNSAPSGSGPSLPSALRIQREPPEIARVLENEVLPAQIQNHRRMLGQTAPWPATGTSAPSCRDGPPASAARLVRLPKLEHKVFPPARQAAELRSAQGLREVARGRGRNHLRPMHVDSANGSAFQQRPQMTDQHFDFR